MSVRTVSNLFSDINQLENTILYCQNKILRKRIAIEEIASSPSVEPINELPIKEEQAPTQARHLTPMQVRVLFALIEGVAGFKAQGLRRVYIIETAVVGINRYRPCVQRGPWTYKSDICLEKLEDAQGLLQHDHEAILEMVNESRAAQAFDWLAGCTTGQWEELNNIRLAHRKGYLLEAVEKMRKEDV